ncbi:MAG: Asp-tRNA(Asn)/Glu-tRNA(Gln) amidotransferase subunit GatA [Myxococcales bacterium]|nr:Asp-tRNA(Asn)/Glu-tRNA(Gln) amidotransferase subunit GatA [Myxococcales bacterium]
MNTAGWTIAQMAAALRERRVTSTALVTDALARIRATEKRLNAWLTLAEGPALARAAALDARLQAGDELPPLAGVPLGIKDNFNVVGLPARAGSKILGHYQAPYESTATARLLDAGAVLLGKTNQDEFAMGSSGEYSAFGPTHNPWNLDYAPGGSSSGSAAAVAAGHVPGALGTDTGGSIRQPASHCGIVGIKPTYGRVSRYGIFAFASSLDQIGPLTRTVRDAALLLQIIAGADPHDATSAPLPVPDYRAACERGLQGLRIGVPKEYFIKGIAPDVEAAVRESLATLEKNGAKLVEISLPHTEYCVAAYYLIAPAEASSNLARYDGVRYGHRSADARDLLEMYTNTRLDGFGPEVTRRILIGTFALSAGYYDAYYAKAQKARTLIRRDFVEAFKQVDVIGAPTAPETAIKLGARVDDPLGMYLSDILTISVNLAGLPGLVLPCGRDRLGLPIGLQFIGPAFGEEAVFQAAAAWEALRRPEWTWPEVTA